MSVAQLTRGFRRPASVTGWQLRLLAGGAMLVASTLVASEPVVVINPAPVEVEAWVDSVNDGATYLRMAPGEIRVSLPEAHAAAARPEDHPSLRVERLRDGSYRLGQGGGAVLFTSMDGLFTVRGEAGVSEATEDRIGLSTLPLEQSFPVEAVGDWWEWREIRNGQTETSAGPADWQVEIRASLHRSDPVFRIEAEFINQSGQDLWIAGYRDAFRGRFDPAHTPSQVYARGWTGKKVGTRAAALGEFNVETLQYGDRGWAALVYPDQTALLLSTLREHPREHLVAEDAHRWAKWHFGPREFYLGLLDWERGQVPIRIAPDETARFGFAAALVGPARHPYAAGRDFFRHIAAAGVGADWAANQSLIVLEGGQARQVARVRALELGAEAFAHFPVQGRPQTGSDAFEWTWKLPVQPETVEAGRFLLELEVTELDEANGRLEFVSQAGDRPLRSVPLELKQGRVTAELDWGTLRPNQDFYLRLVLSGPRAKAPVPERLRLAPPPPPAPELIAPVGNLSLPRPAAYFSWQGVDGAGRYELEWSRDAGFGEAERVTLDNYRPKVRYFPLELPEPGDYHWRVRAVSPEGKGAWSPVARFKLEAALRVEDPDFPISPERPLFIFEAWKPDETGRFMQAIPEDLSDAVAVVFSGDDKNRSGTLAEWLAPALASGRPVLLRPQGPWPLEQHESLAEIAALFAAHDNLIGVQFGERFWGWGWRPHAEPYTERLLQICGHYGKRMFWGDSNPNRWNWQMLVDDPKWRELLQTYAAHLSLMPKNNLVDAYHVADSSVAGLWLSGWAGTLGIWAEAWYWHDAGFGKHGTYRAPREGNVDRMPGHFWLNMWLAGAARGATVFCLDGQVSSTSPVDNPARPSIWTHDGAPLPLLSETILPFIRALRSQPLIPDRAAVRAATPFAVRAEIPPAPPGGPSFGNGGLYGARYATLFSDWLGLETAADGEPVPGDLLPQPRFDFLPLLVPPQADPGVPVRSLDEALAWLEAHPASEDVSGFAVAVGENFYLQNSRENDPASVEYPSATIDGWSLRGEFPSHALAFGRVGGAGESLHIWLSNPANRPLSLTVLPPAGRRIESPKVGDSVGNEAYASGWRLQLPARTPLQSIQLLSTPDHP